MKTLRIPRPIVIASLVALMVPIVLFAPKAYAESYVAGQFGATFPQSLSNGKVTQDGFGGLGLSDQPLQRSALLGAKFGHYFEKARWLGVEAGVSYTTPHRNKDRSRSRVQADRRLHRSCLACIIVSLPWIRISSSDIPIIVSSHTSASVPPFSWHA